MKPKKEKIAPYLTKDELRSCLYAIDICIHDYDTGDDNETLTVNEMKLVRGKIYTILNHREARKEKERK